MLLGIYRAMKKSDDGLPEVGNRKTQLGVSAPDDPPEVRNPDVEPDNDGFVACNVGRGMSVAPCWWDLPSHQVPKRLAARFAERTGVYATRGHRFQPDTTHFWRLGNLEFHDLLTISETIQLEVTSKKHGVLGPRSPMRLKEFREALAETRTSWIIDED